MQEQLDVDAKQDSRSVRLCQEGIQAEFQRRLDDARRLYAEAWDAAADDYEATIAAHYVAHLEPDPAEGLRWNLEALTRAGRVGDERVAGFMGSLYVCLGRSYELIGDPARAARYYELAAQHGVTHEME